MGSGGFARALSADDMVNDTPVRDPSDGRAPETPHNSEFSVASQFIRLGELWGSKGARERRY
jgi:hypothetical protein